MKKKKSGAFDTRVDKSKWTEASKALWDIINEHANAPPEPCEIVVYFDIDGKKKWDAYWEEYFNNHNNEQEKNNN